jgi:hypothetical protein
VPTGKATPTAILPSAALTRPSSEWATVAASRSSSAVAVSDDLRRRVANLDDRGELGLSQPEDEVPVLFSDERVLRHVLTLRPKNTTLVPELWTW